MTPLKVFKKQSQDSNVQVCDATEGEVGTNARTQKYWNSFTPIGMEHEVGNHIVTK